VFCAHLLFVFVGLALLYGQMPELHGIYALALLTATFLALIYVAQQQVRRKHKDKQARALPTQVADTAPL
jgi:hypothetical protein